MTLLEMVQRTLSALKYHNVNSLGETLESNRVQLIVNSVLEEIYGNYDWEHRRTIGSLEVTATPNEMVLPSTAEMVEWIHYRSDDLGRYEVKYEAPHSFFNRLEERLDGSYTNIDSVGAFTDRDPRYWTTYDNEVISFDGYDGTLAANRTNCMFVEGLTLPTEATDVPDIPARFHYAVLHGIKAMAYADMKGDDNQAKRYHAKYMQGRAAMKRYMDIRNTDRTTWTSNYGRKRISSVQTIDGRNIIDT